MITLYNENCLDVFKRIADESIDLICTDPPYRLTSRGGSTTMGGMLLKNIVNSGKVFNYNDIKPSEYATEFYRVLKDGTHCYVMTNHINLVEMITVFESVGFHFIKCLIWDKQNKISSFLYMSQYEYILFFSRGKSRMINNCGTSDILSIPNKKTKGADGNNIHDTEKPIELMKILVENSTNVDETVLDPFMGVGSTGIASKQLNRNFIGCEIDEHYFKIAESRINNISVKSGSTKTKLF